MNWHTVVEAAIAVVGVTLAYFTFRRWLPRSASFDFEPELSITRKNGWAFLDLVLINHSKTRIWAEQAVFALADLDADFQAAPAKEQESLKIREYVRPGEALRISLVETVYNAAGKPQGEYSFLISGTVRYRAGNGWYEIALQTYRVRMIALSAVRLLRMRWYDQPTSSGGARGRLRKISGDTQDKIEA